MSFADFFRTATENHEPYGYQCRLACGDGADPSKPETLINGTSCASRLISIPTGLGKTAAVVLAWMWNRVALGDEEWPRRLVYCLPMRTLVEQTAGEVKKWLDAVAEKFPDNSDAKWLASHSPVILMGGEENDAARREWDIHPEKPAILIGTQDMLLSRALNRGYGMSRARWPMHFALLNNDALWIMDETQLMDVGLSTSAQLQSFRDDEKEKTLYPCFTWWMSATLQPDWLKSPETTNLMDKMSSNVLTTFNSDRKGPLWKGIRKELTFREAFDDKKLASFIIEMCPDTTNTIVIVNTVKRATAVYDYLVKNKQLSQSKEIYLVHSRFRPVDRKTWRDTFLRKQNSTGRPCIIVATQVIEAGVDISADTLITDLAPWTSLIQRFGRAARYGGFAKVVVIDIEEKSAAPYDNHELVAARAELKNLTDVALPSLEFHEASLSPDRRAKLYPFAPKFLLLRNEIIELFDTSSDLSGADIDIARFIRSGKENDCHIAWLPLSKNEEPSHNYHPSHGELCAIPIGDAFKFIAANQGSVWKWDYIDREWKKISSERDIYPGLVIIARADAGGYSTKRGFDPSIKEIITCSELQIPISPNSAADAAQDDESLSEMREWQTIAIHGQCVAHCLRDMNLSPPKIASILDAAARWHDLGKAHPAFVSIIKLDPHLDGGDIAKAPEDAWLKPPKYKIAEDDFRPGFRHELASTLALIDLLKQYDPNHEALLGPWADYLCDEIKNNLNLSAASSPIQEYLSQLLSHEFNLLLYLIAAHHGKVRISMQASPSDQDHPVAKAGDVMPIRGIIENDKISSILLTMPDGTICRIPETRLTLQPAAIGLSETTGPSWTDRCRCLVDKYGLFTLSWLETLIRAADAQASK